MIVVLIVLLLIAAAVIVHLVRRPPRVELVPQPVIPQPPVPEPARTELLRTEPLVPEPVPAERARPVPVVHHEPPTEVIPVPPVVGLPGGSQPVEPQGLPEGKDAPPDSVVDGATAGPLVIRAGSVRGDSHRRFAELRRDAFRIQALAGGFEKPVVAAIIAVGDPHGTRTHLAAARACQSVLTQLSRLAGSIGTAWNQAPDLDQLRELLTTVCDGVSRNLEGLARDEKVEVSDVRVELTCLLSELGDASTRRHLVFRVGRGVVLRRAGHAWQQVFPADGAPTQPVGLPGGQSDALQVGTVDSAQGDALVVASAAAHQYLTAGDSAAHFAREWGSGPRDLVEFLWQLSARTSATKNDRTVICLWDFGQAVRSNGT